ncbi:PAS domain-containing protein [Roseivirga sp. BDSF3-8]|uniref:PAS domain-containing protein n=1 Tax=Roseivirga sp. BDSF3-8 TaxID=3241598 RepID=UPI003531B5F1
MGQSSSRFLDFGSLRNRIILSLTVMGGLTLIYIFVTARQADLIEETALQQHTIYQPGAKAGERAAKGLHKSTLMLTTYLQSGEETYRVQWEAAWEEDIFPAVATLKNHRGSLVQAEAERIWRGMEKKLNQLRRNQADLIESAQNDLVRADYFENNDSALSITQKNLLNNLDEQVVPASIDLTYRAQQLGALFTEIDEEKHASLEDIILVLDIMAYIVMALCVVLSIAFGIWIVRAVIMSIYRISKTLKALSNGNLPEPMPQERNETRYIIKQLNALIMQLRNVQHFATLVGKREFDNDIVVFNNEGVLGESLAGMRSSLSQVAREDRQRNWVNEGLAQFADILRNKDNIKELCDEVIVQLTKYSGAIQGGIFLVKDEEENEPYMELISCYAFERHKKTGTRIHKGEGIAGQSWQENDTIIITEVPDSYINIRSGLGHANPKAILVVPLVYNEETIGVVELASFKPLEDYQVEFIQKLSENLAASIATTTNNERTRKLLEESQEITEQMLAQEEEMRQNMEELQATQEEMRRTQNEIRDKESNLNALINNTNDTIFAIDRDYCITVVNDTLRNKYKKAGIDLKAGVNILEVLPADQRAKWKERYDRALSGESYKQFEERMLDDKLQVVETYHNPIMNVEGKVIGVSVIARDVTDIVQVQRELERKQGIVNSVINNTDDTFFAIDQDFRITIVNETLRKRFESSGMDLKEGDHILEILPQESVEFWRERYQRTLNGESFTENQERKVGDKSLYIKVYYQPVYDENGKITGASVLSRDITEYREALEEKDTRDKEIAKLRKALGVETNKGNKIKNGRLDNDDKAEATNWKINQY